MTIKDIYIEYLNIRNKDKEELIELLLDYVNMSKVMSLFKSDYSKTLINDNYRKQNEVKREIIQLNLANNEEERMLIIKACIIMLIINNLYFFYPSNIGFKFYSFLYIIEELIFSLKPNSEKINQMNDNLNEIGYALFIIDILSNRDNDELTEITTNEIVERINNDLYIRSGHLSSKDKIKVDYELLIVKILETYGNILDINPYFVKKSLMELKLQK